LPGIYEVLKVRLSRGNPWPWFSRLTPANDLRIRDASLHL